MNLLSASTASTVARDASSYVDPNGYVFHFQDEILRAVNGKVADFYRELIDSGYAQQLHARHGLVKTAISPQNIDDPNYPLVLHHEKIRPLTYCVEWAPAMHQAAAAHLLELLSELLERGYTLQDAYPWNTLFDGTKPVFVDFTSLTKINENSPLIWPAYGQYQSFFAYPLALCQMGKGSIARKLLSNYIDGISLDELYQNSRLSYKLTHPQLLLALKLNQWIQTHQHAKRSVKSTIAKPRAVPFAVRRSFIRGLSSKVARYAFKNPGDVWQNYYAQIDARVDKERKLKTVGDLLAKCRPATVLDLGCNTGVFSLLAARTGARVLAVDSSEECANRLFFAADHENLKITPLIMDVLNPTPAFGFMSTQFPAFTERGRSELVMCLGLMHHLHISGRQSFARLAQMLSGLVTKFLIFEFVALDDANNELINMPREINYDLSSVQMELGKYFTHIDVFTSDRATRRLLLCRK